MTFYNYMCWHEVKSWSSPVIIVGVYYFSNFPQEQTLDGKLIRIVSKLWSEQDCYLHTVPAGTPWRSWDVTVYVLDINQPSLPTPFSSVLVSVPVFMALSSVLHSINYPDNSPLFHSVLPVLFLPHWSFQLYIFFFMKVSLSPDIILCGWLGLKHQLTN